MSKTLGGSSFVYRGCRYDYSFKESILSLLEFCDKVSVVVVKSPDNTEDIVREIESKNKKLFVTYLPEEEWEKQKGTGKTKLCYFSDIAISKLDTDFNYYQQADEVTLERCYPEIRKAIEVAAPAYMISRINLWGSPYTRLSVSHDRLPCSELVIRLAKTEFRTYGDAESLAVPFADSYFENSIRMYHTGFVRKREVMKDKIINMQCGVFEMADYDKKLDLCETFNPKLWFDGDDLVPIDEPLPKLIQEWAKERHYDD